MQRNVGDLADIALRQRVLRDVADIDLSTTLFGRRMALPVGLGPVGRADAGAKCEGCAARPHGAMRWLLAFIEREMGVSMALTGVRSIAEIDQPILA